MSQSPPSGHLLYAPLNPCEIRLLTLHPSSRSGNIQCSLHHATLPLQGDPHKAQMRYRLTRPYSKKERRKLERGQPVYEALSYCWGPEGIYKTIEVNGRPVPVRRNLWWALHHLRHRLPGMKRTLWVDALCINQEDVSERNEQVSIMGSIFSIAKRVLAWLGEESPETKAAFKAVARYKVGASVNAKWHSYFSKNRDNFVWLMGRPYFGRLWIIQELCLASDGLICCGPHSMRLDDFQMFWKDGLSRDEFVITHHAIRSSDKLKPIPPHTKKLLDLRASMKEGGFNAGDIEKLVWTSLEARCLDPRDRIYGMIGLLSLPNTHPAGVMQTLENWELPVVDYFKSTQQLYCDIMIWRIENEEPSCKFRRVAFSHNLHQALQYPFWEGEKLATPAPPIIPEKYRTNVIPLIMYQDSKISWIGPILKPVFDWFDEAITWQVQDEGLEPGLEACLKRGHATSFRNNRRILERNLICNPMGNATALRSVDTDNGYVSPRSFRICKCDSQVIICPSSVELNDFVSRDLCILYRKYPGTERGDIIGRAIEIVPLSGSYRSCSECPCLVSIH